MKIKLLTKHAQAEGTGYVPVPMHPGFEYSRSTEARGYDWLVAYDEMPKRNSGTVRHGAETLDCPFEQTLFVAQEPVCVKSYGRDFVRQFGHYLTTREPEAENHPNYHLGRGYYETYYGVPLENIGSIDISKKVNLISTVCSSKQMRHTCHSKRFALISHLAKTISGFEWYGRGVKSLRLKCESLDTYKYHVAVENYIGKGHCTEKLIDSILGECLTFYAGDPDVGTWLPKDSFVPIPLDDHQEAERIIRASIEDDLFEKRIGAIKEAKRLILEKYNFWAQIIDVIKSAESQQIVPRKSPVKIKNRHRMRLNPIIAMKDTFTHISRALKNLT